MKRTIFKMININEEKKSPSVKRIMAVVLMVLLNILFNSMLSAGIGISPADKTIYFQPSSTTDLSFNIINSGSAEFNVSLSASGELKEMIFFQNPVIKVKPEDYRTPFKVMVKLPAEMEPGIHTGTIHITPLASPETNNGMAAYITLQLPIHVKVPYPGKYADVSLFVVSVDEGTPVPVYVQFDNLGSEDILNAGADVSIADPDGKGMATMKTPNISIGKGFPGKTLAEPSPLLRNGFYTALVNAHYDGTNKSFYANFTIGEPRIRIKELLTKEVYANEINKVDFWAYNEWNTELTATGFMKMTDKENEMPSFNLAKHEEKKVTGFVNTTGLAPGRYPLNITLIYSGQMAKQTFQVTVVERVIKLPQVSVTWLFITLVLLAIVIALIIVLREKRKITNRD